MGQGDGTVVAAPRGNRDADRLTRQAGSARARSLRQIRD